MRVGVAIVLVLAACGEDSKRVFTTSAVYTGLFGGLEMADARCAQAVGSAGLGGEWIALLSGSATKAIDRVQEVGPWTLITGEVAFQTREDMAAVPLVAINIDEQGRTLAAGCAWTGSRLGATTAAELCLDWTVGDTAHVGRTGNIIHTDMRWIEGLTDCGAVSCNMSHHLYCIEQ